MAECHPLFFLAQVSELSVANLLWLALLDCFGTTVPRKQATNFSLLWFETTSGNVDGLLSKYVRPVPEFMC